jgi:putative Mn2+ efflux pump MntP
MTPASRRRTTLLFSALEAGMPLVGLALGASLGRAISSAANYVAVGILIAFGLYALTVSQHDEPIEDDAHLGGLRVLARLGHRLSEQRREQAEKLAGLTLITLGLILLAERLLG